MKILHTADWHVGKVLKNQPRFDEHRAVLGDIERIARDEDVDLVVVAGDLFETSTPGPDAQGLVMKTLMALRADRREVVVLAGNHDNQRMVDKVYRPVLGELGLHVVGTPQRPENGGLLSLRTRTGEDAKVAVLPFVSYRHAVRAAEVLLTEPAQHSWTYANRVHRLIDTLTAGFTTDTVNLITTHATLLGGRKGGGERAVQTLLGYELPAQIFPSSAHYVALGHLHRYQEIEGPCPIAYSGSPLALDFGEENNEPVAIVVTATPDIRANARPVPVTGGRRLRTIRGTLDHVIADGEQDPEAYLRVILTQQASAGLGDQVREKLTNAIDVQIDERYRPRSAVTERSAKSRLDRSPVELFADFLAEQNVADERVSAMFAELLENTSGGAD